MNETNTVPRERRLFASERLATAVARQALEHGIPRGQIALHLLDAVEEIIEVHASNVETARNCLWRLNEYCALSEEYDPPDGALGVALKHLDEVLQDEDACNITLLDAIDNLLLSACNDLDDWNWNAKVATLVLRANPRPNEAP